MFKTPYFVVIKPYLCSLTKSNKMRIIKHPLRCAKLIEMLEVSACAKDKLLEAIEDEFGSYSLRTMQRDFREIAAYLGISIAYNRSKQLYEIKEVEEDETCKRRLDLIRTDYVFSRLESDNKLVYLDQRVSKSSNANLGLVFSALRDKQELVFDYHSFWKEPETEKRGLPMFLKEFDGRWYIYLIYTSEDKKGEHRRLPLDRMQNIKTEEYKGKWPKVSHDTIYQYLYGIIVPQETEPQEIQLKVSAFHTNYLEDIPLHASQVVEPLDDGYKLVSLKMIPTIELDRRLLSFGANIEVLSPASYREHIARDIVLLHQTYQA